MPLEKLPLRQAMMFLRGKLLEGKDYDERLEIEAMLGDPVAKTEREERRLAAVVEFDFEVA